MELTAGARLRSQVCATEIIVVRAPGAPMELSCGGAALVTAGSAVPAGTPVDGLDGGSQLGKRYTTAQPSGLEVLVVKAGAGTLTSGGEPLVRKDAKPLPASD